MRRRWLGPTLAGVLAIAVGAGIWQSGVLLRQDEAERAQQRQAAEQQARQIRLVGLIGSEKAEFFADARVRAALARHGLEVTAEKAGSRAMAAQLDPARHDFAFPAGEPAAVELRARARAAGVSGGETTPFYTPIVIASWQPIAAILEANGLAHREGEHWFLTDLPQLIALMNRGTRWSELKDSAAFPTRKAVLVGSTDLSSSNSAAMYLSLLSYVANGDAVVQGPEQVQRVLPAVAGLFRRQGFQQGSSQEPFQDYLALGMGKAPLLVAYESQLVEFWLRHPQRRAEAAQVMLYPRPTVYSKHVLVPFSDKGRRLAAALEGDAALRTLAHEFGLRTGGEERGPATWARQGIQVPETLVDVVDPPDPRWLEALITAIETPP